MNYLNEKIRCLQMAISQYERMSMLCERSSDKWEYMRKAKACRIELENLLGRLDY